MADDSSKDDKELDTNASKTSDSNLEDFIMHHYRQQKEEGHLEPTEEIGEDRTDSFFKRAIGESRRMNAEVEKSQKKRETLHEELGASGFAAWQQEHAAEVLLPEQAELLALSQGQ